MKSLYKEKFWTLNHFSVSRSPELVIKQAGRYASNYVMNNRQTRLTCRSLSASQQTYRMGLQLQLCGLKLTSFTNFEVNESDPHHTPTPFGVWIFILTLSTTSIMIFKEFIHSPEWILLNSKESSAWNWPLSWSVTRQGSWIMKSEEVIRYKRYKIDWTQVRILLSPILFVGQTYKRANMLFSNDHVSESSLEISPL
jgi:hypothetical protein